MDGSLDPKDIIEDYHKKKKEAPRLCKKCGKSEMKKIGVRMSASVNYMVWRCEGCGAETLEFVGLSDDAEKMFH
ncbi:MAG: hypothetical protein ACLFTR_00745 [Candidatus Woesearchaeota archaeon]